MEHDKIYKKIEEIRDSQIRTEEHTRHVDSHLKQLNGKVAQHAKDIGELKLVEVKMESEIAPIKKIIWRAVTVVIGVIITGVLTLLMKG